MKRSVHTPLLAASLAALVCLTALGCGGGGGGYDSPQAAFDAMKAASEKKDWKGVCNCMTPDSQDAMAGMMVLSGTVMKAMGAFAAMAGGEEAEKAKAALEKIDQVLKKHGLTEDAMKKMKGKKPEAPDQQLAVLKELTAPIKDKPAFVAEMIQAFGEMGPGESEMFFHDGTLKDVKISGDTATGTVSETVEGEQKDNPISFKKTGGGWLVELPLDKMQPGQ